jgi:hypothetical protein
MRTATALCHGMRDVPPVRWKRLPKTASTSSRSSGASTASSDPGAYFPSAWSSATMS